MPKLKFSELDWGSWLYALLKAVMLGAGSAVAAYVSMPVMTSMGVQMPTLTLRQVGMLVLVSVFTHLAAVLVKSPLPPPDGSAVEIKAAD